MGNEEDQQQNQTTTTETPKPKPKPRILCLHGFRTSGEILKKQEFTEYKNFDECLAYIEECMIKYGPIDGLLGFSQGAILSAALPGLQAKGVALTKVPKIKFLIIVGGAKFREPSVAEKAYSSPIQCPSLHFLGETDFLKQYGIELLDSFVDPLVINHPKGHTIPRIDDKCLPIMLSFIERIQEAVTRKEE